MNDFIQRLRERKLVQWALAYVAFAFALLQGIDIVAQRFVWPDAIERILILVLCIGFFVALVLAWYHGERGAQRVSSTEIVILALLLAIGGGLLWRYERALPSTSGPNALQRNPGSTIPDSVTSGASSGSRVASASIDAQPVPIPTKSIAVLPFENLSEDKGNAYFADGMQDLILTKLAGIGDLKVISRTSTEKYQSHPDNLKIIAQQLGVATILEGSVQKAGNQVLINVQLIDARSDNHLWAESYTRTLDNIFGVEGEVAQKVADALQARLTNVEQQNVAAIPTQNVGAYNWFLKAEYQGNKAFDSQDAADFKLAEADYRQAITLDPGFALAYARLAYWQMVRHWFVAPLPPEELAKVKATIDHALALAPDLPETHLALGYYYYWGYRRYGDAVAQFQHVLQLAPNNVQALGGLAFIDRRRGQWPQALASLQKALLISPRDTELLGEYGWTLCIVRRYPEAERQLERALAIEPAKANNQDALWSTRMLGFGNAEGARKAYEPLPGWRFDKPNLLGDVYGLINRIVYPDVFERHYDAALRDWDSAPITSDEERLSQRAARVAIQVIAGRQASIQSDCLQLKPLLDAELAKHPDVIGNLQQASWVDVCLDRNAEAIASARRASEAMPISRDAYFGAFPLAGLAEVEAHAGAKDQALQLIDQLMAIPAGEAMSVTRLKLDPVWDPLRDDLRFQALLKKYEKAPPATSANVAAP